MEWEAKWGAKREQLETWAARGEDVPALRARPELYPDLVNVWRAFWELSRRRPFLDLGAGSIPLGEVLAWCELNDVHGVDDRRELLELLDAMDAAYLAAKE